MKHKLTGIDRLIRDLKLTKRNYQLDDCLKTARYVGKCIKAVKWCKKRNISGERAAELIHKFTPENFMLYTKRRPRKPRVIATTDTSDFDRKIAEVERKLNKLAENAKQINNQH